MAETTTTVLVNADRPRELRCKRRACQALLARVIGVTLVCLDGTRVGPVQKGQVIERKCPRCGARNVKWL